MKLKTRIIISFFIIVLEPLLFTGLAFWAFSQYQFKVIEKQYGIENPTYQSLSNTAELVNNLTNEQAQVMPMNSLLLKKPTTSPGNSLKASATSAVLWTRKNLKIFNI